MLFNEKKQIVNKKTETHIPKPHLPFADTFCRLWDKWKLFIEPNPFFVEIFSCEAIFFVISRSVSIISIQSLGVYEQVDF